MNKGLFASLDKLALRTNMPTDRREFFFRREESRSSLHTLLKSPSFIDAAFRAEKPEKMAKSASSSESWASYAIRARRRARARLVVCLVAKKLFSVKSSQENGRENLCLAAAV